MKICYLSEMLGPHDYRFLGMLLSRGYETVLVTYRKSMDEAGEEAARHDVRNLKGLKIIHNAELIDNTPAGFFKRARHFKALLKKEKPDVLHAGWIQTSGFLAALSGFHPFLLMPWGTDITFYSKSCLRNRLVTRYTVRRADMITCDCNDQKDILVDDFKYPSDRVVVIPWAVDRNVFNKGNSDPGLKNRLGLDGKKVLLMMRIFRPVYAIDDFIRSLPAVRAKNPDTRALVLGYGPLEKELKALASSLGLDDFIIWTGYVPQHEVVKYMNISDVYVSSSLMDGSSASLLEAMSVGLPVVVTDIPGNREWVENGKNGILAGTSNPGSIAEGINRLLDDEQLRRSAGAANERKIELEADFRKNFGKLEGMYKAICEKKKRAA